MQKRMRSIDNQASSIVYEQEADYYNSMCNGIFNVLAIFALHRVMGMPYEMVGVIHRKMRWLNECVESGRLEYTDMEELIVTGTDPENSPIKWTDYKYPHVDHTVNQTKIDPDATRQELLKTLVEQKRKDRIDCIMHAMELMYMVALHDIAGYGKTRCKRFVNAMRKYRTLTNDEFKNMFKWLCKHGVVPDNWEAKKLMSADDALGAILNQKVIQEA